MPNVTRRIPHSMLVRRVLHSEPKNPGGHAAYGVLIKVDGIEVLAAGKYVGFGDGISNNVAEYAGVIRILEEVSKIDGDVAIFGDSMLVVNQLSGKWGSNGGHYVPYMEKAKQLLAPIANRVSLTWVPREKNERCDVLSKQVLKDMGVEFRIQDENAEPCPGCHKGKLIVKSGSFGEFIGCTRYPKCKFGKKIEQAKKATPKRWRDPAENDLWDALDRDGLF